MTSALAAWALVYTRLLERKGRARITASSELLFDGQENLGAK